MGTQNITRDELYALVWSDPMTVVAARLGMSDVGLRKVCVKHNVPVPPRGYWAKLKSPRAKRPRRRRLPPIRSYERPDIQIQTGTRQGYSTHLSELALAEGEFARAAALAREANPDAVIAKGSKSLHPIVALSKAGLKEQADPPTLVSSGAGLLYIDVSLAFVERAILLADTLVTALEHRGHLVVGDAEGVALNVAGEIFRLRVYETRVPVIRVPADKRLRAEREEGRRPARRSLRWWEKWREGKSAYNQWGQQVTGRLAFSFGRGRGRWWTGIGAWHDRSKKTAEDFVREALVEIEAAGAAFAAQSRLRQEERKREEREAQARRRKARLRTLLTERAKDHDRLRQLTGLLGRVDAFERVASGDAVDVIVRELRAMIAEAESGLGREALEAEFAEWLEPGN